MGITHNYGKVRTFIDWEDKGVPVFDQINSDSLNLIVDAAFLGTEMNHTTGGDLVASTHIAPDSPMPLISFNRYKNVNPYGIEFLEFNTTTGALYIGTSLTTPLTPDTDYTLWMWMASENVFVNDGTHFLSLGVNEYSDPMTITQFTDTNFDAVDGWTVFPVFHHFTSASDAAFFSACVLNTSGDSTPVHAVILGMDLLTGSGETEPTWNAGTVLGYYDEITGYVLSADGSIGKTQWETKLFDEGNLNITLDNQSKFFSPENRDSPLFGFMNPYLRIWVLFSDSSNKYTMLWSGYTQQFALQTGIYNTRQAVITCRQGKYSVDAQDVTSITALASSSSEDAVVSLFNGGYLIPTGTIDPTLTTTQILENSEVGTTIPIFGVDLVGQKNPSFLTALENIGELNGNYLWLSRYGRVIFKAYPTVKDADPDELAYGLTLETHYTYAPMDLYKSIVVNYDVYAFAGSGIEMQGQEEVVPSGSSSFPYAVYPQYNGKPLIGNVVLDVASFLPVDYNVIIASGSANASIITHTEGIYTWYATLANNTLADSIPNGLDARISFVSRASSNVWYASEVNKSLTVTGIDGRGLPTLTYQNPLISTDTMASDFANQQAERRSSIVSWFDNTKIANKNAAAIEFVINHSVGSVIYIQEEQSGNIPKHQIIIGEQFTFTPTQLEISYSIAPTGGEVDIVSFTYAPTELLVDFTDHSVVVPEATYLWDFGD